MTVRQRIILLLVLTFAALGSIGGFALYQSKKGAREVRSVTEGVVPSTIQSVELMGQLKDIQIATLSMVAAPDKEAAQRAHEKLSLHKASLEKALQDQAEHADSHAQRGIVKEAQDSLSNYFAAIDDTANFKLAGQQDLAEATMAATVDQYLREQGLLLDALQLEKRRSKDEAIEALNQNLMDTSATLAAVTVVSVLGLAFIGYLLYRQIIHPIGEMEAKMTAIATSQDFTHRVPVTRQDEIGRSLMAFNTMVEKIQQSSELVRQKNADIQAMLHYIPQGILTLQSGGLIHPEFSEHLTALLERRDIAGQTVADVVFAGADIGVDARDQALAAIDACIGEDAMNFDFNAHLLPREIVRPQPDGSARSWELGWSPITSEGGTIERLMLCIRDVTELRQLAHAAHAQQQELAIIGQILGMDRDKFQSFVAGATAFLQANERLIGQAAANADARPAAIAELFRNMHTIKGNARTYGLQQLTDVVHAAEQRYDQLRQDPAAWATDRLQSDLAGVREMLAIYQMVNEVKLRGWSADAPASSGQMVALAREQVEALARAMCDAAGSDDMALLRSATVQAGNALHGWVGVRLSDALSGPLASLPSLAKELDKEPPLVQVNDADIVLRHQIADMLRDVFTHLLRNSMDHGIEEAATRMSAGKQPAGSIVIDMALNEEHLQLRIADDGRGLDLKRIRAKAQQAGLLAPHDEPSDEALAQLVFEPGFSTASAVTAVSGRGVGMDAVKAFVAEHGGSVALQLRAAATESTQRAFDILIHLPARHALRVPS